LFPVLVSRKSADTRRTDLNVNTIRSSISLGKFTSFRKHLTTCVGIQVAAAACPSLFSAQISAIIFGQDVQRLHVVGTAALLAVLRIVVVVVALAVDHAKNGDGLEGN